MQKRIIIDQERLIKYGLDLIDMAIYDYLKHFAKNIKSDSIQITAREILRQLPALPIRDRKSIYARLRKIESKGLIAINRRRDSVYIITIKALSYRNHRAKMEMYDPSTIARNNQ